MRAGLLEMLIKPGDPDQCTLFTDMFSRFLQVSLCFVAVGAVYVKRLHEHPKRPLHIWAMDVSKQGTGAFIIHFSTMFFSIIFVANSKSYDDECAMYFTTYMLDSTFGILQLIYYLHVFRKLAKYMGWRNLIESGWYGEPPNLMIWLKQCGAYVSMVFCMKFVDTLIVYSFYNPLAAISTKAFQIFHNHRHLELLFVMIVNPGICNAFQFWIVDSYLKDIHPSDHYTKLSHANTRVTIVPANK